MTTIGFRLTTTVELVEFDEGGEVSTVTDAGTATTTGRVLQGGEQRVAVCCAMMEELCDLAGDAIDKVMYSERMPPIHTYGRNDAPGTVGDAPPEGPGHPPSLGGRPARH